MGEGRDVFRSQHDPAGLHECALCRADCVIPVWWDSAGEDHWHMLLRCGACDTYRDVTVPDEVALAYQRELDRGTDEIRGALDRMDRDRQAVQTDAFIAALRRDLIDAGDFARPVRLT